MVIGYTLLVDDLHAVACRVNGIDEYYIAWGTVVEIEVDTTFLLNELSLLKDAIVIASNMPVKQAVKFFVTEVESAIGAVSTFFGAGVEAFELFAQVADECGVVGESR